MTSEASIPSSHQRTGPALCFGDEINTDELHPSVFYSLDDRRVRAGFLKHVAGHETTGGRDVQGGIVLAGRTFGIGSSRETGARVFLLAGIQAVVAVSFATIFQRNLLNLGVPALICPGLAALLPLPSDTVVTVTLPSSGAPGELLVQGLALPFAPLDPYWQAVLAAGGLMAFLQLSEGLSASVGTDSTSATPIDPSPSIAAAEPPSGTFPC